MRINKTTDALGKRSTIGPVIQVQIILKPECSHADCISCFFYHTNIKIMMQQSINSCKQNNQRERLKVFHPFAFKVLAYGMTRSGEKLHYSVKYSIIKMKHPVLKIMPYGMKVKSFGFG